METDKEKKQTEDLFKYYKLYLDSIERISDRRNEANKFFITINTALLSAIVVFFKLFENNEEISFLFILSFLFLGCLIACIFSVLIYSYKQLNTGKFTILHRLEKELPLQLYTEEWDFLGQGKNFRKYLPFSHIELFIPVIFGICYIIGVVLCIYNKITL